MMLICTPNEQRPDAIERKPTMKKRLLSILLLFCMTLTLFPVSAFAEEGETEAPMCVCTEACTEEAVNHDCPVCGAEGAQACDCAAVDDMGGVPDDTGDTGDADDADDTDNAGDTDDTGDADDAGDTDAAGDADNTNDVVYSAYAADVPAVEAAVVPVLTPPTIEGTFYALDEYRVLKAARLTGGTATVNGEKIEGTFALDEDELLYGYTATDAFQLKAGTLTRTVIFTPTDTAKYTSATCTVTVTVLPLKVIKVLSIINVIENKPVGTEFAELGLPVDIEFEAGRDDGSRTISCPGDVIWDESKYDKNSPNEQTITGTLDLSRWKEYIVQPSTPLTTSIKVKLKYEPVAPTIVTAPVFRWTKGEFALGNNQIFVDDALWLGTDEESGGTGALIGGGAKIGETVIDGTFALKQPLQWFDREKQYDVTVVFTPKDQDRYAPVECMIKIDAIKRTVASIVPCTDITGEPVGTAFDKLVFPFVDLYTEDGARCTYWATWDGTAYDPYSIEEQTITGTINLDQRVKQPEPEIKATVNVKLEKTSNTIEIRYHMYSPDGYVEYKADGTGAILTDYTTAPDDYKLRDFGAIFQALQAAGMFTGLSEAGSVLDGWYKADSFADTDRVADISQLTVTGNRVDLHGKIIPKTITITLELGGGTLPDGESSTVTRTYGSGYNLPKPTRHGYSFTSWYTAETGGSAIFQATTITQTTDHTVYARWKQDTGHSPVRAQTSEALAQAATCTTDAVYYMSCSCGEIIKTETFTAENTAGHDYGNWTSNHDGTHTGICSRNASHTVTEACSGGSAYCMERAVCEKCKTEYGELGGHIFGSDWKCDNTYHWHECSGCKGVDSKVLHADNDKDHRCDACYHLLGTCADNNNDHKCDVCGKQLSECADNNKDHLCDTCGKKLTEHTGGTATCTAKAVCTVCGEGYGEMVPHSFTAENTDAKYLVTAASCTAKAVYHKSCAVCGAAGTETFEYGEMAPHSFTAENTDAKYLKTAAACTAKAVYYKSCAVCGAAGIETFEYGEKDPDNHSGREEWTVTAGTHEQKWSCCGKVTVPAEGHSFGEWVVTKSPTYSQRGIRTHTCVFCGYYESEYTPATGGGKTPQTGDDSALGLWSLLMCASLTGALSLTVFGLRRRTKKTR